MRKSVYLSHVKRVRKAILEGDLYQANLTRKFTGTFAAPPDHFGIFRKLCRLSPAPYSAYLKLGNTHILSSSPERFLWVNRQGLMETRPIKGSMRRAKGKAEDSRLLRTLRASEKNRAENLMIVDLMRNDFAKVCEPESVRVKSLFDINSYATVHHLSSTVIGRKRKDKTTLDAVKACFPPGSMTGAPKIQAMRLCTELERMERGVYSGAIGWFGGDGSADLSVVIRTLIIQGERFEFQVGGGIVADSDPLDEWEETLVKARAMAEALGIPPEKLRKL